MISKSTEFLGPYVENDYAILAVPVDVKSEVVDRQKLPSIKNLAE